MKQRIKGASENHRKKNHNIIPLKGDRRAKFHREKDKYYLLMCGIYKIIHINLFPKQKQT